MVHRRMTKVTGALPGFIRLQFLLAVAAPEQRVTKRFRSIEPIADRRKQRRQIRRPFCVRDEEIVTLDDRRKLTNKFPM